MKSGELSRAARVLTSKGLAPANEETTKKLEGKHPKRYSDLDLSAMSTSSLASFDLSKDVLLDVIKSLPRDSAAGPSGWRYEHIKALVTDPSVGVLFHQVCSLIANGRFPQSVAMLLSASRLIALPKASGDVWPIAIGECFRWATARAICAQKRDSFSTFFCPL